VGRFLRHGVINDFKDHHRSIFIALMLLIRNVRPIAHAHRTTDSALI